MPPLVTLESGELKSILKEEYLKVKSNLKNVIHSLNYCGICLKSDVNLHHLDAFDNNEDQELSHCLMEENTSKIFEKLIINNISSQYICQPCNDDIKNIYIFFNRLKNSTEILSSYLEQMTSQIDSVEEMLNTSTKGDFENTIIVLQDLVSKDTGVKDKGMKKEADLESDDDESKSSDDGDWSSEEGFGKLFTCEYCCKDFTSKVSIAQHIRKTHNYKSSSCQKKDLCSDCTESPCAHEKYLLSIKMQRQKGCKQLKCLDCDYISVKKVNLLAHINKEHLNMYPYLCEVCAQKFYSKVKHDYHMKHYHKSKFVCSYCDEELENPTSLALHTEMCKQEQRKYRCKECPASFDVSEKLLSHRSKHVLKVSCALCSKRVKNEHFLQRHMYYAHQQSTTKKVKTKIPKARPCSICPVVLHSLTELKEHLNSHEPGEKHKCHPCNKLFDTRKHYNIHVSSWTHLRKVQPDIQFNFKCPDCDFTCKSNLVMENHKNTVHLQIKPYSCEICGKRFTTNINLKYHMDRHEGVKRFQCSMCSNLFTTASGLKKHVLRHHSDKRPFACDKCEKTFVCPSECNLHKLRNHSEKSVACPLCEAKFSSMANLRGHTKKVHFKTKHGFEDFMRSDEVSREFYEMFRDHRFTF
ncbi:hypothetical protein JYU34_022424 [Plutella xylostella]|uniref:C2H2-type domain-containing protein n=1 Tax=Plutella xylostella TaxID=51655 RepID=A0ABQ7PQZ2_PLUXY|nr:hypothetical protein JYU34_022424 [Plutella xylostella]